MTDGYYNNSVDIIGDDLVDNIISDGLVEVSLTHIKVKLVGFDYDLSHARIWHTRSLITSVQDVK